MAHGLESFLKNALPPIGCVVEDAGGPCGMAWAYCSCNIGLAFVEGLVMRPGMKLSESAEAGRLLLDGIAAAVKPLGYNVLLAYALKGCARIMRKWGWQEADERAKLGMVKII